MGNMLVSWDIVEENIFENYIRDRQFIWWKKSTEFKDFDSGVLSQLWSFIKKPRNGEERIRRNLSFG